MTQPPRGTVTFLFTDLKASTRLWEEHTDAMHAALARHDELMRDAIESHRGYVVKTTGDGSHGAFSNASDALDAAIAIHRALSVEEWGETGALIVRVGLHTGESELRDGDYYGPSVNRAARLMDAGHGGQILLSRATADLVRDHLADAVTLVDLGEHRLRDLSRVEQIFEVHAPGLASEFPPLRTARTSAGNLPSERDEFVGREEELAELAAALRGHRLVTLVGAGGVGKTRLAVQSTRDALDSFDAGAWLVELQGVGNEDLFDDAVAAALGVEQRQGLTVRESVLESLRDKQLVLILDNCEHLVAAAAEFVEVALARAPGLHIVATSREGLGIRGEHVFTVPVLGLPDRDATLEGLLASDAIRLFVTRAAEVTGDHSAPDDHLPDIATLCRRLDGLPLAIELAAARRRSMTPAEIAAHLDRRFRMLTGGRRTAVSRHQTMRNAIDWSYDLLDADERELLRRAAVFAGSFDLEASEAVAVGSDFDALDVVDILGRLVDKSLVVADSRGNQTRYRLLETVRDYAWERLEETGEADTISRLHAEHFVVFSARAGEGLRGPDEAEWIDRLDDDLDNLHTALRWAIAVDDADIALQLVAPLTITASASSCPFGSLAEDAAAMPGAEGHALRPITLAAAAYSARRWEPDRAVTLAELACAAIGDRSMDEPGWLTARCMARGARAVALASHGGPISFEAAHDFFEDARRLGDPYLMSEALNVQLGSARSSEEALSAGEEGVRLARVSGNPSRITFSLLLLAVQVSSADTGRARELLAEAAEHAQSVRNEYATDFALQALARVQLSEGDLGGSAATLALAFERANWSGDRSSETQIAFMLAHALASIGAEDDALALGSCLAKLGHQGVLAGANAWIGEYAQLRNRATPDQLAEAMRRTEGLDLVDLVALACDRLESSSS